jgi:predicted RNase H-like HicB family nuclease
MSPLPASKGHGAGSQTTLPLLIEKDEDGFYVVECPVLAGCYTQGDTLDEALKNIQEVIQLLAEEKDVRETLKNYAPGDLSFHTITIKL